MKIAKRHKLKSRRSQKPFGIHLSRIPDVGHEGDFSRAPNVKADNVAIGNGYPASVSSSYVTAVGGNIFLDLGFPPDEAAQLKEEIAQRISAAQGAIYSI